MITKDTKEDTMQTNHRSGATRTLTDPWLLAAAAALTHGSGGGY